MAPQARALEKMLFLATGILGPNLLAIDALNGEALLIFKDITISI